MERTRKKQNAFVRYFTPFGLKQICDIAMLVGFVLLIVGLCTVDGVLIAGFIVYALASGASVGLCIKIMIQRREHKKDPSYKSARVNLIIMSVLFALAVFGLIWAIVG